MKSLFLISIFVISLVSNAQPQEETRTIGILPSTTLKIKGNSNINSFECVFNSELLKTSYEIIIRKQEGRILVKNALLVLPNFGFACGNRGINKDFYQLLKTTDYPEISLELLQLNDINEKEASVITLISIAGISRSYKFGVEKKIGAVNEYSGKWKINITDFNLIPPKKAFGLITIQEDIEINFKLDVRI